MRAASFRISYEMCDGPDADASVAVTAWTRMGLVDPDVARPRRVTAPERAFLGRWGDGA